MGKICTAEEIIVYEWIDRSWLSLIRTGNEYEGDDVLRWEWVWIGTDWICEIVCFLEEGQIRGWVWIGW